MPVPTHELRPVDVRVPSGEPLGRAAAACAQLRFRADDPEHGAAERNRTLAAFDAALAQLHTACAAGSKGPEWAKRFTREAVIARAALTSLSDDATWQALDPQGFEAARAAAAREAELVAAGADLGNEAEAELAEFECGGEG